jgi:hypothetical protein
MDQLEIFFLSTFMIKHLSPFFINKLEISDPPNIINGSLYMVIMNNYVEKINLILY